jgi:hypothetical protein
MSEATGSDLYDYTQRLAELETLSDQVGDLFVQGSDSQANELLRQEIGQPELYWAQFKLPIRTILVLDVTLQVRAGIERKRTPSSGKIGDSNASPVLALMADGRKPMGHWLVQQEESIDCSSLDQLSGKLGDIDRDRLADWSSERHLLGPKKASALLKKLGDAVDVDLEMRRYRNARFFSFLIDFVICATEGVPPEWSEAQAMVRNRYRELLGHAIPA